MVLPLEPSSLLLLKCQETICNSQLHIGPFFFNNFTFRWRGIDFHPKTGRLFVIAVDEGAIRSISTTSSSVSTLPGIQHFVEEPITVGAYRCVLLKSKRFTPF